MKTIQTSDKYFQTDLTKLKDWHEFEFHQGGGKSSSLTSLGELRTAYVSISKIINAQIGIRQPEMNWQSHLQDNDSKHIKTGTERAHYVNSHHLTCNLINLWILEERTEPLDALFIDEADISLKSFFTWNLAQKDDRWVRSYDQLIYRLNSTPKVLFMGAQSNGMVRLINERICGRAHTLHKNTYKDLEGKDFTLCDDGKQIKTLIEKQLELRLSDREKYGGVYVASENTSLLAILSADWIDRFKKQLKTKIVVKDQSLSNEELKILGDPNKQQDWDLMLCSPKTKDGIHIIGGFDLVAGLYSGKALLGDEEVINALLRVRTCKKFALHIANTKLLEGHLTSKDAFENPQALLMVEQEKFKRTNHTTGKIEKADADLQLFTQFSELDKKEARYGRKKTIPEKLIKRGGTVKHFEGEISQTIPENKKTRQNRQKLILQAKPYKANEWGQRKDIYRQIHTEILQLYGEVNEETYERWDGGDWKENNRRADELGETELNGTPKNEAIVKVDKWIQTNTRFMENYIVATKGEGGDVYQIPRQVLYSSPMWKELLENKDQWNIFFGRVGLTGIEIKDKHTNPDTNSGMDLYMRLIKKFNWNSTLYEAKPQKAKTLTRQLAEPQYRPYLKQWRAEGNKSQPLERYFWEKLLSGEETLRSLTKEAIDFIGTYPYVVIQKDKWRHSNYISLETAR